MFLSVFLFLLLLVCVSGSIRNTTCSTDMLEATQSEILNALKEHGYGDFRANNVVTFDEEGSDRLQDGASLVWQGKRASLDLSIFRVDSARDSAPFRVTMSKKGDGNLAVQMFASVDEDVTSSWSDNMNSAWEREERSNVCEMANFNARQLSAFKDDSQNIIKCIACFSIMGLTLPILWNLIFGYGFSLACQVKGYSQETCEELSIDFVLAMEMPIIFICALQTMNRCVLKSDNCESYKLSLESAKNKPLLLL